MIYLLTAQLGENSLFNEKKAMMYSTTAKAELQPHGSALCLPFLRTTITQQQIKYKSSDPANDSAIV